VFDALSVISEVASSGQTGRAIAPVTLSAGGINGIAVYTVISARMLGIRNSS
jgi:hypothetical protein